ncbi:MAG TPA: dihydropteroate synthase [Pyrinomonadaceae bacterium]|nr:dihydropteroate synthase [Pyrinomonadaceae bacterium]
METRFWKLARRELAIGERTLVMGVLNVTPDSFSDGGRFFDAEVAVRHAERMIEEGADIIDMGGESTRPGGAPVGVEEESGRVLRVVEAVARVSPVPVSIDTTKAAVARRALDAGAEVVNDISGLRFDPALADEVARTRAGLVLMHSRGEQQTLHALEPVADIWREVFDTLRAGVGEAARRGVARAAIAVDPGIGFGKSQEQNVELVARLGRFAHEFEGHTVLVGTSRKSFIGRITGEARADARLHGTMATVTAAILQGAHVIRVHDVRAAVEAARVADALKAASLKS